MASLAFDLAGTARAASIPWYESSDWVTAYGTWALAGVTALLWLFTALMWMATKRVARDSEEATKTARDSVQAAQDSAKAAKVTADTMRHTAKMQLRAYLALTDKGRHDSEEGGILYLQTENKVIATVFIKNTGATPAYDVKISGHIEYRNVDSGQFDRKETEDDSLSLIPNIINPGEDITVIRQKEFQGTTVDIGAVSRDGAAFHFFGRVDYLDAFDDRRYIDYHFIFWKEVKQLPDRVFEYRLSRFEMSPSGNDAN